MASPSWRRFALPVSVLLVVAYWATSTWATLLRPGGAALPGSVRAIAVYVCIKTALALAVVWTLLRATEEHLASLGFTVSRLRGALVWGPLVAAGVFLFANVVLGSVLRALGTPSRPQALPALFRDPREAPLWVFIAVVGGGFTEELLRPLRGRSCLFPLRGKALTPVRIQAEPARGNSARLRRRSASARRGAVENVVTSAMSTIIAKMRGERTPTS